MSARNFHVQKLAERVLVSKVENFALESARSTKKSRRREFSPARGLFFFYFKTRVTFSSSFFIICDDNINAFLIFIQPAPSRGRESARGRGRDDFLLLFQAEIIPAERASEKRRARERIKECSSEREGGMEAGMSSTSSIGNTAREKMS